VSHLAVGCFNKTELVHGGVSRQPTDQADVRTFRGFNRADAAIVREVHVAHVKTSPFAAQAARAKRGDGAFMAQLAQGVGFFHELRKLAGAKEFAQGCNQWTNVHQANR